METVAITLTLLGSIAFLSYFANQIKVSSEGGTKYGAALKVFYNTVAYILVLLLPFTGMQIADNQGWENLASIMEISMIPVLISFIVYGMYLIIAYFEDIVKTITGKSNEMEEFR